MLLSANSVFRKPRILIYRSTNFYNTALQKNIRQLINYLSPLANPLKDISIKVYVGPYKRMNNGL